MIFDNADGDDKQMLLDEFWPEGSKGSILITSRDHRLTKKYPGLELREMKDEDAVKLLLDLTDFERAKSRLSDTAVRDERHAASEIVKRVGHLPFGIAQAATLILNDECSLSDFLAAYTLRDLVEDCEPTPTDLFNHTSDYKYSLRTVWDMNFEHLIEGQQNLIKLMSFLDPDRVQLDLLRDGAAKSKDVDLEFIRSTYKVNKCKSALLRSSLVSQSEDGKQLRMHRLVQASCQSRMKSGEARTSFKCAISLVKAVWPVPPRMAVHNPSLWEAQRALLPHVQKLCDSYVNSCRRGEPLVDHDQVNWAFASILYEAGWQVPLHTTPLDICF